MSLHDVNGRLIDPDQVEASEHIQYAKRHLHPKKFERVLQTIDEAIEQVVVAGSSRFSVWMNTGSLVGDGSRIPHGQHQHLWDAAWELFPGNDPVADKEQRIVVGSLIKWRTALRDEPWLVHYRPTGKEDVVTGDEIFAGEYWIKPAGVPFRRSTPKRPRSNVIDLQQKWNRHR